MPGLGLTAGVKERTGSGLCNAWGKDPRCPSGNNFSGSKGFQCAQCRMDWAMHYCSDTEPWPSSWDPPQCVCKETSLLPQPPTPAKPIRPKSPPKLSFVPSENAPIVMKLMELEGVFREFFWNSNSHSRRSSKLRAEQNQVSI